jgi:hypothetical protein
MAVAAPLAPMNEAAIVAAMQRAMDGTGPPVSIPFAIISSWVDSFAAERRIGGGGFGDVYVGVLMDRSTQTFMGLAVKKLLPVRLQGQELEEWKQDSVVRVTGSASVVAVYFCVLN